MPEYGAPVPSLVYTRDNASEVLALQSSLRGIGAEVTRFWHCLLLLEECRRVWREHINNPAQMDLVSLMGAWKQIAARDGALCIKDFEDALLGANGHLAMCTQQRGALDGPTPFALLDTHFPTRAKVRHSAAHNQLQTKNEKQRSKHATDDDYEGPMIALSDCVQTTMVNVLQGSVYTTTWEGMIVSYDLSLASLQKLEEIKCTFFRLIPTSLLPLGAGP